MCGNNHNAQPLTLFMHQPHLLLKVSDNQPVLLLIRNWLPLSAQLDIQTLPSLDVKLG